MHGLFFSISYYDLIYRKTAGELHKEQTILLPPANEVWGKVIFSEACVNNSVHRGVGVVSQHALQVISQHALQQGGVPVPGGSAPRGGCAAGGMLPGGTCSQEGCLVPGRSPGPNPRGS